jgi:hypothetical protein
MSSGGGGSSAPTQQTVTQVTIPPEIMPYAKKLLGTAEGVAYGQPYQTYGGQRVAGLNPLQQQAFQQTQQQQLSPQLGQATGFAGLAGLQAQQLAGSYQPMQERQFYQPMDLSYGNVQAPGLQQFQMGPAQQVQGQGYGELAMGAPGQVQAPELQQFQMGPALGVQAFNAQALGMAAPERVGLGALSQYQMGPAERVQADRFGIEQAREYMSPYMQDVVEQQKRAAVKDYARELPGMGAAAARAGAKGGTREALVQAEAQRGLQERLGGIEATGRQQAFQQAQQQFAADRAAQMQAAQLNQAAGLTTGQQNLAAALGVQQLGTQAGLQAALANQQAGLTTGQQNLAAGMQAQQLNAQQALEAQRLNQAAGLTTGQQNLAAALQTQQLGAQQGLQAQLANQQMGFNVAQQNLAAEQARRQFIAQQGMQAQLANQQAGLTTGQQNLAAALQTQGLGAGQALQAQQLNQAAQLQAQQQALAQRQQMAQYGLQGAELADRSRQFRANLGLQGIQQQLAASGQLGQLGQQQFAQQQGINQAQMAAGAQLQQMEQARLQAAYEDFLNRQRYPYQQLGFMSDLIRGTPTAGGVQSIYGSQASPLGALAGLGGLYMAGKQG